MLIRYPSMKTRYGCLTLLGLFAVAMTVFVWTAADPPDNGAAITVMGLFALVVIYVGSAIEWLTKRGKREARGFPIEPTRRDGEG
jgi:peptidoglycan/LPS O-acetylase OafA/YrhL